MTTTQTKPSRERLARWYSRRTGESLTWLCAAAVALALLAVLSLVGLLVRNGLPHFWPKPLVALQVADGGLARAVLALSVDSQNVSREQLEEAGYRLPAAADEFRRQLFHLGNRDLLRADFAWILDADILSRDLPPWAAVFERREWGSLFGYLVAVTGPGQSSGTAAGDQALWQEFQRALGQVQQLRAQRQKLERGPIADTTSRLSRPRAVARSQADAAGELERLQRRLIGFDVQRKDLAESLAAYTYTVLLADGRRVLLPMSQVVRSYLPNQLTGWQKTGLFLQHLRDFLTTGPSDSNTEGGVFPAIFGTVALVLLMSIIVTPLGVLAAVYLHEYARQGIVTRLIRIAVNNLAGVPSLVYGVFGLGFFVYFLGGQVDELLFSARLPSPTFGTPGLLWASLTLALLTLPVVIVATEEGLARISRSLREGSLALGATRAETLWRVVLPMASPAMMTGLILAIARAAGEVAPLMLVGVVKLAPALPITSQPPYLHLEQKFMHLGFHIYDLGFQSPNLDATRSLVYATALLLVLIIVVLNFTAIVLRNRLREKYKALDT